MKLKAVIFFYLILTLTFCKPPKSVELETAEPKFEYHSTFSLKKYYVINNNGLVFKEQKPEVVLWKTWSNENTMTVVMVDSIYFNSASLRITLTPYYTTCNSDTVAQNTLPPYLWKVTNLGEFPPFIESVPDSMPKLSSYNSLPDSISVSRSTLIYLEGANATDMEVMIMKNNSELYWALYRPINNSTAIVSTPSNLQVTNSATLTVNYKRGFYKTIDSKEIFFSLIASYSKQIKIVP